MMETHPYLAYVVIFIQGMAFGIFFLSFALDKLTSAPEKRAKLAEEKQQRRHSRLRQERREDMMDVLNAYFNRREGNRRGL